MGSFLTLLDAMAKRFGKTRKKKEFGSFDSKTKCDVKWNEDFSTTGVKIKGDEIMTREQGR